MVDLSHPKTYWEGKRAGHKQCRKFLKVVADFKKVIALNCFEELRRRETLLDLTLAGNKGLVSDAGMR